MDTWKKDLNNFYDHYKDGKRTYTWIKMYSPKEFVFFDMDKTHFEVPYSKLPESMKDIARVMLIKDI